MKTKSEIMKRTTVLHVRLRSAEKSILERKSEMAGMSRSDFIRHCIIRATVVRALTPEELRTYQDLRAELRNIGTNLNILAKKASAGFARDYRRDMDGIMTGLGSIIDAFAEKLERYDG